MTGVIMLEQLLECQYIKFWRQKNEGDPWECLAVDNGNYFLNGTASEAFNVRDEILSSSRIADVEGSRRRG